MGGVEGEVIEGEGLEVKACVTASVLGALSFGCKTCKLVQGHLSRMARLERKCALDVLSDYLQLSQLEAPLCSQEGCLVTVPEEVAMQEFEEGVLLHLLNRLQLL